MPSLIYRPSALSAYLDATLPRAPLTSPEALMGNFCHVALGFCRVFNRTHESPDKIIIMEAGPGSIIPPLTSNTGLKRQIDIEVEPNCEIHILSPAIFHHLMGERPEMFVETLSSMGNTILSSQTLTMIKQEPHDRRIASLIARYSETPLWTSGHDIISLPPFKALSEILDLPVSDTQEQITSLIESGAITQIQPAPEYGPFTFRLNLAIEDESILAEHLHNSDAELIDVLTIGTGASNLVHSLDELAAIRHTHYNNTRQAIRAIKRTPGRFDLIIGGKTKDIQPYQAFCTEVESGSRPIHKVLSRTILLTPQKDVEYVESTCRYRLTVRSFNDSDTLIIMALQRITQNVIQLALYR